MPGLGEVIAAEVQPDDGEILALLQRLAAGGGFAPDKFADERYLHERLCKDTRRGDMRLEHRTKAESDVAIAAASILARDRFVGWLDKASRGSGYHAPEGSPPASDHHRACASGCTRTDILREYAKVSFKTTRAVLENTP
jgi:ribonuclease HIII